MRELEDLLAEVKRSHFPLPPASLEQIERAERGIGQRLPDDLRQFYLACGGALLFADHDAPYEIVEPELLRPVGPVVLGDDDTTVPASWICLCYVQDANYVAIDLPAKPTGEVWLIDCFHETIGLEGDSTIIALSFREFLERALASKGQHYWLGEHPSYGDAYERSAR